ncbi:MAG: hypothetical protein DRQ41_01390 [Gammaproteobacteria bacterium]|nr:MAG: hypothetical protein DRQ41_01390 [Gammaproteobacteria bacterium]RKZ75288.1 MAG: hypothetical protein DRQ57_08035 [Gammaproteobacteria bacterium]
MRVIDFAVHKYAVEKYIVNSVVEKLLSNRKEKAEDVIQESTQVINNCFSDIKLFTKLVDITAKEAIFESFNCKIRPRSRPQYANLTFCYKNLSVSCEGFFCKTESLKPKKEFCEHRKGNEYDVLYMTCSD